MAEKKGTTKNETVYVGGKLHKGQSRIVNSLINSKTKFNIINASRQSGKTYMLQQLILYYAINFSNKKILVVSPYNSQNLRIYGEIKEGIVKSGIIKSDSKSDKIIELINGSKLIFKSAENFDAIRGITADYVFGDEFAFWKKDVWSLVVRPTMAAKINSRAFLFSTPRGKNEFYDLAIRGRSTTEDNANYSYHYMSYEENPMYDKEMVEDARKHYPPPKFKQEFLGEFIDGGSVFEKYIDCAIVNKYEFIKQNNKRYFAGLDLANKMDKTVLTIVNNNGKVVYIYAVNHTDWKTIVNEVVKILKIFDAHCIIEVNNIGDVVYELIEDQYKNIEPIYTNNANKQDYIEQLILAFDNKTIQIPTQELEEELHLELDVFEMSYSNKARKTVYAAREGFHDDYIISLALANKAKNENKTKGKYILR